MLSSGSNALQTTNKTNIITNNIDKTQLQVQYVEKDVLILTYPGTSQPPSTPTGQLHSQSLSTKALTNIPTTPTTWHPLIPSQSHKCYQTFYDGLLVYGINVYRPACSAVATSSLLHTTPQTFNPIKEVTKALVKSKPYLVIGRMKLSFKNTLPGLYRSAEWSLGLTTVTKNSPAVTMATSYWLQVGFQRLGTQRMRIFYHADTRTEYDKDAGAGSRAINSSNI
ncbi:hypothetical protein TEQG_01803 [Trichophyton equinum CBS 127.97]|uniref:Uncharacterized protein n=1 Tax=Trichophyton equinum (strain ATCC MYA-4606 / CBS 127.97) TaxID=559882 RepID=F2PLJ8_TRIEC|nr:hypothetical protein TEQG_01803 [Trichophyton equinum CBS 127.97]